MDNKEEDGRKYKFQMNVLIACFISIAIISIISLLITLIKYITQ